MNKVLSTLKEKLFGNSTCQVEAPLAVQTQGKIAIVGSPNVGKSLLFNRLTGSYVTVSNYPGTTVEIYRGKANIGGTRFEVIDTPGMYSLLPITEEERVARRILLEENPRVVLHVIDAKNLERMLPLTLQLIEGEFPAILVLNIMDEAERMGLRIDAAHLEEELGIPVVATVSTTGRGMSQLRETILRSSSEEFTRTSKQLADAKRFIYDENIEAALASLPELVGKSTVSPRLLALLYLQGDSDTRALFERERGLHGKHVLSRAEGADSVVQKTKAKYAQSLAYVIALRRQEISTQITLRSLSTLARPGKNFAEALSRITMNPWTGLPILGLVLYFGIYKFVGVFGAGTLVNYLENSIFGHYLNPIFTRLVETALPWKVLQDLLVHEFGIITLGVRYAVAIILPIVGTFFIAFAVIEDTGYLPRLAMLIDRLFKKIGLSGRAVIPIVLGLGCDTMATMVTRTLPTKRERVMATLLLALAVPCSAQLGVILGLLAGNPKALGVWLGTVLCVFLLTGFLAARILPGEKPIFFMEVPPLRLPKLSNVLIKTYTRMAWYFKEIFPLFIAASILIWAGKLTGLFNLAVSALAYPVRWIGLPEKTAVAFLFGFFRRDYGAAGLYDMHRAGLFSGRQLAIAVVTLTLFLPCIAQFLINLKERGWKTGVAISVFIFFLAFGVGGLLNFAFQSLGVNL